jgi:hypothetical protein
MLVKRVLEAVFTLGPVKNPVTQQTGQPVFTNANGSPSGQNQLTITGHRMLAFISKAGGMLMSELHLKIFGMSLQAMNDLSTLGQLPGVISNNTITLMAGDADGTAMVFQGTVSNAWVNFEEGANASFDVIAHAGSFQSVQNIAPTSFKGGVDAATIIQGLADQMGLPLENNGVSGIMLSNPYYSGSARTQFEAVKAAAGINGVIDNGVVAIWPRGSSRNGTPPLISKDTGLIGYPTFNPQGICIQTLYNPSVVFGGEIQVQSIITPACGTWRVYGLDHELSCEMPGGPWFSRILAGAPGQTVVVQ